jgi:hypothetical protein
MPDNSDRLYTGPIQCSWQQRAMIKEMPIDATNGDVRLYAIWESGLNKNVPI